MFSADVVGTVFSGVPLILEQSVCYVTMLMQSESTEREQTGAVLLYVIMCTKYLQIFRLLKRNTCTTTDVNKNSTLNLMHLMQRLLVFYTLSAVKKKSWFDYCSQKADLTSYAMRL